MNNNLLDFSECYYRKNFHIICPSCGGTRFLYYFITGDFVKAFRYHPTSFVFAVFLIVSLVIFVIDKIRKRPTRITSKYIIISLIVYAVATIIQYFVRVYLIFNNIENPFIEINI